MRSASNHKCVMNVQVWVAHVVLVLGDEVKMQLRPFPRGFDITAAGVSDAVLALKLAVKRHRVQAPFFLKVLTHQ